MELEDRVSKLYATSGTSYNISRLGYFQRNNFIFLNFIPFLLSKLFDYKISYNFYNNILFWETPEMESGWHISTYLGMEEWKLDGKIK